MHTAHVIPPITFATTDPINDSALPTLPCWRVACISRYTRCCHCWRTITPPLERCCCLTRKRSPVSEHCRQVAQWRRELRRLRRRLHHPPPERRQRRQDAGVCVQTFCGLFARVLPQLGQIDGTFLDAAVHCHTDCQSCCKNMVAVVSGRARARAVREQFDQTRFTGTDDSETSQRRIQRQLLLRTMAAARSLVDNWRWLPVDSASSCGSTSGSVSAGGDSTADDVDGTGDDMDGDGAARWQCRWRTFLLGRGQRFL